MLEKALFTLYIQYYGWWCQGIDILIFGLVFLYNILVLVPEGYFKPFHSENTTVQILYTLLWLNFCPVFTAL